ncbi:MAG: hypothetical protein ACREV7_18930 [Steroidobacteraceae bacterium]
MRKASDVALTLAQRQVVAAGTAIALDRASDQDKAFLARQLVQTTLPHSDPGDVPVWSRTKGNLTLTIQQGYAKDGRGIGHPYGTIPRLLLYWMTTEALRIKSPRLELGRHLAGFMEDIGLDPARRGPRSDRVRLEQQMRPLFAARVSFEVTVERDGATAEVTEYMPIARRGITATRNVRGLAAAIRAGVARRARRRCIESPRDRVARKNRARGEKWTL